MLPPQDQGNRRAGARGLTRNHGGLARSLRRAATGAVCAAAIALPLFGAATAQAATTASFTPLTLVNGWTNYGSGLAKAAVANINGIVHLKGGIKTTGTNAVPFYLPVGDRPSSYVYVPVDECGATNGRLYIAPSGQVTVDAEGNAWNEAQCFVSLDGAQFATSASSFTPLTPLNGWGSYGHQTASPAARNINGIVYLQGAIQTSGTSDEPFILPVGDRPQYIEYVPVDMDSTTNGRLVIYPDGELTVQAQSNWSDAAFFTSLDGVSFSTSQSSFTPLALENGWQTYGSGTAGPAARVTSGVVHLEGAIAPTGTNATAFTLPTAFRPAHDVYVKADMCNATNGRLHITTSGSVTVQTPTNGTCFTSLDGISFAR